jgi:fumarylacetoacetase
MIALDRTHDPSLCSWVESANGADTDFPLQNLPYGRFRRAGGGQPWRIGVAIGDQVLDLARAALDGNWDAEVATLLAPLAAGDLRDLMARPAAQRRLLRAALSRALNSDAGQPARLAASLVPQADAEFTLPCVIGDYTDFYTGIHHAATVGSLFRPNNPLLPNYKWVPIGYHGRSSSLVPSGHAIIRPVGQLKGAADAPRVGPTQRLDYELELGFLVGPGNALGAPIAIGVAEEHLFGVALLNDWSARDIQSWEYQPLGPFLSKNFGSTIAPWVVTMEALAPFRVPFERPAGDPAPLPYLDSAANRAHGMLDIHLAVSLQTRAMRDAGLAPARLSASAVREAAYWTPAQLVAHHTINGCNLQAGDLLGSGTLSGPRAGEAGSLLELTLGGERPLQLPNGERRTFLDDGDTITIAGWCDRAGARRIGFGPCSATVRPAPGLG